MPPFPFVPQPGAAPLPLLREALLSAPTPTADRACGTCTACCTVLAVDELQKPMRWACSHLAGDCCAIYADRPAGCRQFNCLWLRGALPADDCWRPDQLGVIFDFFYHGPARTPRFVAMEVWTGAFEAPLARAALDEISAARPVDLSYRDGRWRSVSPAVVDAPECPTTAGQLQVIADQITFDPVRAAPGRGVLRHPTGYVLVELLGREPDHRVNACIITHEANGATTTLRCDLSGDSGAHTVSVDAQGKLQTSWRLDNGPASADA